MNNLELNEKIKNNAISAYFFLAGLILLSKNNPLLDDPFVKSHAKIALIIHLGFLITYIVFISFWLGINFSILNYSLSEIIATTIFIALFMMMLYGAYKAHSWEVFKIWESIKLNFNWNDKKNLDINLIWNKLTKIISVNSNKKISEKDKVTIILSRIPFLWFLIYPQYKDNTIIKNANKVNLIITVIITLLFISWASNLSTLLLLVYIIFIVFLNINLVIKNEVISFDLEKIPDVKQIRLLLITLTKYLQIYASWNKLYSFVSMLKKNEQEEKNRLEIDKKSLEKELDFKLSNILIYIPILNLISIFNINSRLKKHITNGLIITSLFILSWIFLGLHNKEQILLLFPVFSSIWYLKTDLNYEIPFLYDIYRILNSIYQKIRKIFWILKEKQKEEKKLDLKVEPEKIEEVKETVEIKEEKKDIF